MSEPGEIIPTDTNNHTPINFRDASQNMAHAKEPMPLPSFISLQQTEPGFRELAASCLEEAYKNMQKNTNQTQYLYNKLAEKETSIQKLQESSKYWRDKYYMEKTLRLDSITDIKKKIQPIISNLIQLKRDCNDHILYQVKDVPQSSGRTSKSEDYGKMDRRLDNYRYRRSKSSPY